MCPWGCSRAVLSGNVIGCAVGARRWLPGILFATLAFFSATFDRVIDTAYLVREGKDDD